MGVVGFPAAAGAALVVTLLVAGTVAAAGLRVLTPPDGSVHGNSPAVLIGGGAGGALEVTLNGQKVDGVKQSGKTFTGPLKLAPGKNMLLVKSGAESRRYSVEYRPKDPAARNYRYHDPVADAECKACHPQGVGRTSPAAEAKLCTACHDAKTGFKYLHGPLGAGQCSICHDPHGSAHPGFLVMGVRELCAQCHAQSQSQEHMKKTKNKLCPECHNPHGSEKQYLLY